MPGEQLLSTAVSGWSGPEAAVLSIIGLLAVAAVIGIIVHLRDCKQATERLHARISGVAQDVGDLKVSIARLEERGKP